MSAAARRGIPLLLGVAVLFLISFKLLSPAPTPHMLVIIVSPVSFPASVIPLSS
jgi:hypothetical protein